MPRHLCLLSLLLCVSPAVADPYFRGDLRHRPRLAFDGRDPAHTQRVIDRVDRQEQPWAGTYAALRDLAETGQVVAHGASGWQGKPDKWAVLYGQETQNGAVAAARATVVWLGERGLDPAWRPLPRLPGEATPAGWLRQQAALARDVIVGMYDDWPCWKGYGVINRGIVVADSLAMHALAFDLLAALSPAARPNLDLAERRLGDLASDLRYYQGLLTSYRNNHPIRLASGLGIAALVLNRHDRYRWTKPGTWWHRPKGWMEKAEKKLHPTRRSSTLCYQGATGAFAEGSAYYSYAADLYQPFFSAYRRFLEGGGVPYLASDLVTELTAYSVGTRLPDGRRPQVDNSGLFHDVAPAWFLGQGRNAARSAADQALFLWDWKESGYPGSRGRRAALLLAFDPDPAVVAQANAMASPPGLSRVEASRGTAALRTGWGPQAAHAFVLAQHGEVRTHGRGHESVANGAYAFAAYGDLVTIDPGYFGFSQVEKTNRGEHRSIVLVDGKAAKPAYNLLGVLGWRSGGTDTHVVAGPRTVEQAEVRAVAVESEYAKGEIERTIALIGTPGSERYLLVEDRCRSSKTRRFTTQVQANAGAPKQRPLSVSGPVVRYETWREQLPVCVGAVASAPLDVKTSRRESRNGEGPDGHEAIEYSASGRDVRFLTAVAVQPKAAAAPTVSGLSAPGGALALRIEAAGEVDVVIANPGGAAVQVAGGAGTTPVTTSHALTVVRFDANGVGRTVWTVGAGSVSY